MTCAGPFRLDAVLIFNKNLKKVLVKVCPAEPALLLLRSRLDAVLTFDYQILHFS